MTDLSRFTTNQLVADSATDLVTTSSLEKKFIGNASFTNTSTSAVTVTFYAINSDDTETDGSGGNWFKKKQIQPQDFYSLTDDCGPFNLDPSQKFSAVASTADVINANLYGNTKA